ncbi:hypothetical protein [Promicromonospora sp. NPDC060271]|uniref:hypothetical protein n=1 Tax=Promicromonospora sp. NPDC060271 TaxID=3347089 RepID=UPI0036587924
MKARTLGAVLAAVAFGAVAMAAPAAADDATDSVRITSVSSTAAVVAPDNRDF